MKVVTVVLVAVAAAVLSQGPARAADACVGEQAAGSAKLSVAVGGVRGGGEVAVTVYPDDPRRFLAPHGKLMRARVPATSPVTHACFWLPPGTYALAVYHDANANHAFDRNLLGRPTEAFGFSNDAPVHFALPPFDKVRFGLPPEGRTLAISLRYP
jgi:uncharacterized protein (DUF2141 family)